MNEFDIATQLRFGASPYFVFCDHASNGMPDDLKCLGIPEDILQTHIAWDIGAGALSDAVAQSLEGTLFSCSFSRLVVDPNRDIHAKDIVPSVSDQIPVPGNQMLSDAVFRERIDRFHVPYHDQLGAALDDFCEDYAAPFIIAIHSFTNRLMGAADERPWHVGLLWREDEQSAQRAIDDLRTKTDWIIGDNEPYDARVFNYSIDRHISPRRLPHLTLEVRQDLISDDKAVAETAAIISNMIRHVAEMQRNEGEQS